MWHGAELWCVELSCLSSGLEPVSDTLKVVYSTLFGLLLNVLAPLMAIREIPQEPIYGWPHSADTAVLIMCADILSVSPCQMCLA